MNNICNRCGNEASLKLRQSVYATRITGPTLELDGNFCATCSLIAIDNFRQKLIEYAAVQEEKLAVRMKEKGLAEKAQKVGAELKE